MLKFKKQSYLGTAYGGLADKLKKRAHEVWDMASQGDQISAIRKKQDTARASEHSDGRDISSLDEVSPGELVLLFLGGRSISARVLEVTADGLSLVSPDGLLEKIPAEWVKKVS